MSLAEQNQLLHRPKNQRPCVTNDMMITGPKLFVAELHLLVDSIIQQLPV